jgi:sugar lactone lactonase YvrE
MRRVFSRCLALAAFAACAHGATTPAPDDPAAAAPVVDEKTIIAVIRQGNDAYKRKDYDEFLRFARRASELSPENPDLKARVARALVLSGHAAEGLTLLGKILATGVAYDLDRKDWDAVRTDPAFARARDQVTANLLPRLAGDVVFTLPAPDIIAEAIGWDPVTQAFYVSSVHQRKIMKIDAHGTVTDFIPPETEHWGLYGLQIDAARRRLWVGAASFPIVDGYTEADKGLSGIVMVDLDSGAVQKRFVAADRGHAFGDLGLAPNGDLWFSDSFGGGVWKVPVDASGLVNVIPPGRLRSPQGIAFSEDGAHAYIAEYSRGLYRYDLAAAKLARVTFPDDTLTYGIDGLARSGNALLAVQNGALPHRVARLVGPTSGVVVGGDYVYIAVSQWESFDDDGKRIADVPVEIRRLTLAR